MYMDGLKYQNTTLNSTLKFSLKGPVRTPHYLNPYIRLDMKYKIVNVDSVLFLEERVTHYISEGWIPQGGVCVITEDELNCHIRRYIQAMIKNEG